MAKQKISKLVNDRFGEQIDKRLTEEFGDRQFHTGLDLLSGGIMTTWDKGASDTDKEKWKLFAKGFSEGYCNVLVYLRGLEK